MKIGRNYGCKDSDLILAAEIVVENLKANLDVLSSVRVQWTEDYVMDLRTRIKNVMSKYLSNDSQKNLRNATANVNTIMKKAGASLSFFKTQLLIDFKHEKEKKDEILKTLGFTKYHLQSFSRNQNVLLQLLLAFKENLSEDIRSQLISKGFSQIELNKIIDLADAFKDANLHQENIKANKKQFSQEKRIALNAISDEIKGICKLASLKLNNNPALKDVFNFKKTVNQIATIRKSKLENNIENVIDENPENLIQ